MGFRGEQGTSTAHLMGSGDRNEGPTAGWRCELPTSSRGGGVVRLVNGLDLAIPCFDGDGSPTTPCTPSATSARTGAASSVTAPSSTIGHLPAAPGTSTCARSPRSTSRLGAHLPRPRGRRAGRGRASAVPLTAPSRRGVPRAVDPPGRRRPGRTSCTTWPRLGAFVEPWAPGATSPATTPGGAPELRRPGLPGRRRWRACPPSATSPSTPRRCSAPGRPGRSGSTCRSS